jgi:hypothetical protein
VVVTSAAVGGITGDVKLVSMRVTFSVAIWRCRCCEDVHDMRIEDLPVVGGRHQVAWLKRNRPAVVAFWCRGYAPVTYDLWEWKHQIGW